MKTRRIRGTFLLRCVVLAVAVAIPVLIFLISQSLHLTAGTLIFLFLFWVFGIELDLFPLLIEQILVRRAKGSTSPVNSLWFVDLDQERESEFDAHSKGTSDNPTIR